jgi:hypothetical protein
MGRRGSLRWITAVVDIRFDPEPSLDPRCLAHRNDACRRSRCWIRPCGSRARSVLEPGRASRRALQRDCRHPLVLHTACALANRPVEGVGHDLSVPKCRLGQCSGMSPSPAWQAVGMAGSWEPVEPPRPLTQWEKRVLARLAPNASGHAVDAVRVVERCACGCSSVGLGDVEPHFPAAEAEATDVDGMTIWVMLFAARDQDALASLDVLRADGQPIRKLPQSDAIVISKVSKWLGGPPGR